MNPIEELEEQLKEIERQRMRLSKLLVEAYRDVDDEQSMSKIRELVKIGLEIDAREVRVKALLDALRPADTPDEPSAGPGSDRDRLN